MSFVPKAEFVADYARVIRSAGVESVAGVGAVFADRIHDDAVGCFAIAERLAVVRVFGDFVEQLGGDEFVEGVGPTVVCEAETFDSDGGVGAL